MSARSSVSTVTLPVVMPSYIESSFDPSIAALSVIQLLIALTGLLVIERIWGVRIAVAIDSSMPAISAGRRRHRG
jgi:ABC-type spermidine/putrescine transport system permease subunit II